jgi:hypothetical protein
MNQLPYARETRANLSRSRTKRHCGRDSPPVGNTFCGHYRNVHGFNQC